MGDLIIQKKLCPECGSVMIKDKGRLGIEFWRCVQYDSHMEPV